MSAQVRQHLTNIRKRAEGKNDDDKIDDALLFGPPDHREKLLGHYKNTATNPTMKHLQMMMLQ
jgi:hypothetical protein